MNFSIDTALRAEYSRRGLSDSFLEGKGSYILYRGRTESFIERNVERADIWMSYYAGRCTGSLVQAAGGAAAMFFGAMDAISGGIGTVGSAALGQVPAAALTAALTVEGVLTAGAGAVVLVDVLRKQAVASAGMMQSVGRGLDRKRNEEAGTVDYKTPTGGVTDNIKVGNKEVSFGHGGRHLKGTGLSVNDVNQVIAKDVVTKNHGTGQFYKGRIQINEITIEYTSYGVKEGLINIGTYYPVQ